MKSEVVSRLDVDPLVVQVSRIASRPYLVKILPCLDVKHSFLDYMSRGAPITTELQVDHVLPHMLAGAADGRTSSIYFMGHRFRSFLGPWGCGRYIRYSNCGACSGSGDLVVDGSPNFFPLGMSYFEFECN